MCDIYIQCGEGLRGSPLANARELVLGAQGPREDVEPLRDEEAAAQGPYREDCESVRLYERTVPALC